MLRRAAPFYVLISFLLIGCTRVVVHKNPDFCDTGVRFWRPKPYLYIGPDPGQPQQQQQQQTANTTPGKGGGAADGSTNPTTLQDNNFVKVAMEIQYLPDYNEEYSIQLTPGLGIGTLNIQLQNGWNLTSVGETTDQQTAAIISSVAGLISAVRGGAPAGGGSTKGGGAVAGGGSGTVLVDARRDVPLGFYEPIFATDPCGRKSLFGWRYVGFLPFSQGIIPEQLPVLDSTSDTCELWGIIATSNSIKFQPLSEIRSGIDYYEKSGDKYTPHQGSPPLDPSVQQQLDAMAKDVNCLKQESSKCNSTPAGPAPVTLPTPDPQSKARTPRRMDMTKRLLRMPWQLAAADK